MSRYIVRCPDGTIWDKVILNFLNGRTRLHNVFNKHKSKIDQIILKYTNKVILSYLLGILCVLHGMLRCPGVISWLFILRQNILIFLMVIFDFLTHSMKINLI